MATGQTPTPSHFLAILGGGGGTRGGGSGGWLEGGGGLTDPNIFGLK